MRRASTLGAAAAQPVAVSALQVPLKQLLDDRQALVIAEQTVLNSLSIIGYAARRPTLAVARTLLTPELIARSPKTAPFIGGAPGALEHLVVPGIDTLLAIAEAGHDSGTHENYIHNYRNTAQAVLDTLDGIIASYPTPPPKITPKALSLSPFSPSLRAAIDLEAEAEPHGGAVVTPRDDERREGGPLRTARTPLEAAREREREAMEAAARGAAGLVTLDTAAGAVSGRDSDAGSVGLGTVAVVGGAALLVWWLATQAKT